MYKVSKEAIILLYLHHTYEETIPKRRGKSCHAVDIVGNETSNYPFLVYSKSILFGILH